MADELYAINDIFVSLQGEGFWAGTPMVFVRFAYCNLSCVFCDTEMSCKFEMTQEQIYEAVELAKYVAFYGIKRVCFTGGEPMRQLDEELVLLFLNAGFDVHIETNGTIFDFSRHSLFISNFFNDKGKGRIWICLSPKTGREDVSTCLVEEADEIKLVYTGKELRWDGRVFEDVMSCWKQAGRTSNLFIQPCDMNDETKNQLLIQEAVELCLKNPIWRLSPQMHKFLKLK